MRLYTYGSYYIYPWGLGNRQPAVWVSPRMDRKYGVEIMNGNADVASLARSEVREIVVVTIPHHLNRISFFTACHYPTAWSTST